MHKVGQDDQRYHFLSLQEKVRSLKENSLTLNLLCGIHKLYVALKSGLRWRSHSSATNKKSSAQKIEFLLRRSWTIFRRLLLVIIKIAPGFCKFQEWKWQSILPKEVILMTVLRNLGHTYMNQFVKYCKV